MIPTRSLPGTDLTPSALGMGCASLGSRYSARDGLRALEAAFDRGVTWFDVAPAYGAGEAEPILARFLKGRRDRIQLCTKVGLAAPKRGVARKLLMPVARPIVAKLEGARKAIRQSGATSNSRLPLTAALIEASIARSLVRLGTDRVEVYALHSPTAADLGREEVLRALERVIERGQARYVAVAGDQEAGLAAVALGCYPIIQLADDPASEPLLQVRAASVVPIATVSHSILGVSGVRMLLTERLAARADLMAEAVDFGTTPEQAGSQLLMVRAFAANPDGVVLASMFGAGNLAANAAAAAMTADRAADALAIVVKAFAAR